MVEKVGVWCGAYNTHEKKERDDGVGKKVGVITKESRLWLMKIKTLNWWNFDFSLMSAFN